MKRKFLAMTATMLTLSTACGAVERDPLPVETTVEVTAWAAAIRQGREILSAAVAERPSITVAVTVAGNLVWSEAIGWASTDPEIPATTTTRYRAYSVAKSLTGTLALKLSQQGKLDLDAPISTYMESIPQATGAVTSRQLLGHLAGIRHYKSGEWMKLAKKHCDVTEEALGAFIKSPLDSDPGAEFAYTSFGFVLASAVLAAASEMPFPALMAQEIFGPAGMSHTSADSPHEYDAATAVPYEWRRRPRTLPDIDNSCKFGAGSMLTTAEDLAAFGTTLLSDRLVTRESLQTLFKPQETSAGEATSYSIGWGVSDDGSQIGHSGGSPGGRAFLLLDREHNVVVALLSNVEGERLNQTASDLLDLFANR